MVAAVGGVCGIGDPGQELVQCRALGGLAAGRCAGVEVGGEVFQGFAVVAFGGGGDGPDPGGEVGGPFGVAAVVVLAADYRGLTAGPARRGCCPGRYRGSRGGGPGRPIPGPGGPGPFWPPDAGCGWWPGHDGWCRSWSGPGRRTGAPGCVRCRRSRSRPWPGGPGTSSRSAPPTDPARSSIARPRRRPG